MDSAKHLIYLTSAYLAPVQYYSLLAQKQCIIEQHDHFVKQTYRNRCNILSANGVLSLSVPIIKIHHTKSAMRDVRIDYTEAWQRMHYRTIMAAYANSPFYLYYIDDLMPFFEKRETFLFDLNQKLQNVVTGLIGFNTKTSYSDAYLEPHPFTANDLREIIHPKRRFETTDAGFSPKRYTQVFADRFGFVPNLSVLDLLFNCGPEALAVLKASRRGSIQ